MLVSSEVGYIPAAASQCELNVRNKTQHEKFDVKVDFIFSYQRKYCIDIAFQNIFNG